MDLKDYVGKIEEQDRIGKYRAINKKPHEKRVKKLLESKYVGLIEENLLRPLDELGPFMRRPLVVLYKALENALYFDGEIPDSKLREKIETEYIIRFGKNLCSSAEILQNNLKVSLKNATEKNFFSQRNLINARGLKNRIELKKINREFVSWFNKDFKAYRLLFETCDCQYKAAQARKDIKDKYSLELNILKRERDRERDRKRNREKAKQKQEH